MSTIQIDVKVKHNEWIECTLYADGRAVRIFMHEANYKALMHDGFFIRNGKELDSANVLNTTEVYEKKGGTK